MGAAFNQPKFRKCGILKTVQIVEDQGAQGFLNRSVL
jgi:hypothetical protein